MIAPAFLFMVGIAIPFSLNSRSQRGASRGKLAWGILRRSILLFLLGLALNELPVFHWHTLHYNGILQLVARSYFVGATLYLAALDMKPTTRAAVIAVVAFAALGAYAALLKLWKRRPGVAKWVMLATLIALAVATPAAFSAVHAQVSQASVPASSTATLRFDIVTVKLSDPTKEHEAMYWRQPDGLKWDGVTLSGMVANAYGVSRIVKGQIEGGPSWMGSRAFDINAKVDAETQQPRQVPSTSSGWRRRQVVCRSWPQSARCCT